MDDHRIDLNLFRVLDAIYLHGGITAAARALHLTQPAVTHALNRLRDHFGDPLFVRQGNRVMPTERTLAMIDDARYDEAHGLLVRIVEMLTKMCR